MAKLQADVESELEGSAENLREAVNGFTADVQAEVEKLREETAAGLGDLKAETAKTFAETASSIENIADRMSKLKERLHDQKTAQDVINRMARQEQEEYRERVAIVAAEDSIAGCVSDIIARLEGEELIATIGVARREIDIISTTVRAEAVEAITNVETRLNNSIADAVNERTSIRNDVDRVKGDIAEGLRNGSAEVVAESLKSRVVEDGLESRLTALERNLEDKVRDLEKREETNAKTAEDSMAKVHNMLKKAEEQRIRLEARVEGVIGQVETERQNEEAEWETSIAAAEAEDAGGDIDQMLSPRANGEEKISGPTGSLPTADVGFPPMSED